MNGLYLHCGSSPVDYNAILTSNTPRPTKTHIPIDHGYFINQVTHSLHAHGLTIDDQNYGMSHDNNRMFSLMNISKEGEQPNGTFQNVLGIRNAHDKAFSAGLVCGSKVFVCDNLAFSGEISMNRKHTAHIMRDLPDLIYGMVSKVIDGWARQEARYDGYSNTSLNQSRVDEIFGSALRNKAIPASKHDRVRQEWDEPKHDEFKPRNAWSLFNSFTEVMKSAPNQLPKRTITLHRVFDEFCDVKMALPTDLNLDYDGDTLDEDLTAEDVLQAQQQDTGFYLT